MFAHSERIVLIVVLGQPVRILVVMPMMVSVMMVVPMTLLHTKVFVTVEQIVRTVVHTNT